MLQLLLHRVQPACDRRFWVVVGPISLGQGFQLLLQVADLCLQLLEVSGDAFCVAVIANQGEALLIKAADFCCQGFALQLQSLLLL